MKTKEFKPVEEQGDILDQAVSAYQDSEYSLEYVMASLNLEQLADLRITCIAVASLMGGLVERFDLLNIAGIIDDTLCSLECRTA